MTAGPELDEERWQRMVAVWPAGRRHRGARAASRRGHRRTAKAESAAWLAPRRWRTWTRSRRAAGGPSGRRAPPAPEDLAAFVHTGGTTGAPKIAAHTHANQLACARGIAAGDGLAAG